MRWSSSQDALPTWRGQNEQGMALAAVAYNKAQRGRQIMAATSSIGPGATNMVTAAAVAAANRLPLLLFSGDTFTSRVPDPVLQQVEHFDAPSTTVNDAFRAVTSYWDRITHPAQIVQSLPAAAARMLDPGHSRSGLHRPPPGRSGHRLRLSRTLLRAGRPRGTSAPPRQQRGRPRGRADQSGPQATDHRRWRRALLGGRGRTPGVRHARGASPWSKPSPARPACSATTAAYVGPIGVTGCEAANDLAAEADVVIAVGCRLQDFTTGSWTIFANEDTTFVNLNTTRFDAVKHRSVPVVGDARETLQELRGS